MARHRPAPVPRMKQVAWTTDRWPSYQRKEPASCSAPYNGQTYYQSSKYDKGHGERIKETTIEYCNNTTLHGLRYTTTTNTKHWVERFMWVVVCGLAVAVTAVLCRRTWVRFQNSPTITTVDNTNHPIWDIPFPAVTICNVNQVYRKAAASIQSQLAKLGEVNETDAHMYLRDLPNLIRPGRVRVNKEKLESIQLSLEDTGYTTNDLMRRLAQPCSQVVALCLWQDRPLPCREIFSPSKSQEGNCCSFNYPVNSSSQIYPTGAGEGSGLVVFIQPEIDEYFATTKPFYAVKVLIHDPQEYPDSANGAYVQPGESVTLAVSVSTIESDQSVRNLKISQRGCLFSDERGPFSDENNPFYNYKRCTQQCDVQSIIQLCDCVPFYYKDHQNNVRVCNLMDVQCMIQYRDRAALASLNGKPGIAENIEATSYQCGCLPECSETFYTMDVIQAKRRRSAFYTANFHGENTSREELNDFQKTAILKVHFEDITCLKYRREALMTWDSLFATFGGIVGLCLGGSVLSVVEIIYYATLRLWVSGTTEKSPSLERLQDPASNVKRRDIVDYSLWDTREAKPALTNDPRRYYDTNKRKVIY